MPSSDNPFNVGFIILLIILLSISSDISLEGEYAPMPPVFLPLSPSNTLLWSCAVPKFLKFIPSLIMK